LWLIFYLSGGDSSGSRYRAKIVHPFVVTDGAQIVTGQDAIYEHDHLAPPCPALMLCTYNERHACTGALAVGWGSTSAPVVLTLAQS